MKIKYILIAALFCSFQAHSEEITENAPIQQQQNVCERCQIDQSAREIADQIKDKKPSYERSRLLYQLSTKKAREINSYRSTFIAHTISNNVKKQLNSKF